MNRRMPSADDGRWTMDDSPDHRPSSIVHRHLIETARVMQQAADTLAEQAAEVAEHIMRALRAGNKVLVCGNGGSAADAQHFAGEMVGRFISHGRAPLAVLALTTDSSVLTGIANDFSYEEVFSRQVEAFAQPGDIVVGISTSGRSANVLHALRAAHVRGAMAIALVGGAGGSIAGESDLALQVPSEHTTHIQECHIALIHTICELVEREMVPGIEPGVDC